MMLNKYEYFQQVIMFTGKKILDAVLLEIMFA